VKHETALIRPVPLAEQITAWCTARRDDIGRMTTDSPADIATEELATIWAEADQIQRELGVWVRDLAVELGGRLADYPDGFDHPTLGTLDARHPAQSTQWDGAAVLSGLSQPLVDGNGEIVEAVPTETLVRVVPGITHRGKPGTSSRWKVSELPEALKKHRTVTYGQTLPQIRN